MNSQIIISNDIDNTLFDLKSKLLTRVVVIESDEFKVEHSKRLINEAYITSDTTKYIIAKAKIFNPTAQNALLKILEEPPANIVFIILTESKSTLLQTIKSRLPLKIVGVKHEIIDIDFDLKRLNLEYVYEFLQSKSRIDVDEAKILIESILFKLFISKQELSEANLELFSSSIKLLKLNSRPINVLTSLLVNLMNNR